MKVAARSSVSAYRFFTCMTLTQKNTPTVYVVDDDRPLRDSLVGLIKAMSFSAQGFASAAAFHRFYRRDLPGCLVLDVRMPGDGIAAARRIAATMPDTRILMLTASADSDDVLDALHAGAHGYVLKGGPGPGGH